MELAMATFDCTFIHAYATNVTHMVKSSGDDPPPFMPLLPNSVRVIMRMKDEDAKQAWLKT